MTPELATPFAVVCHDAGAANLIIAWIQAEGLASDARPVVHGPAAQLWGNAFPGVATFVAIEDALAGTRAVLTGSGWASDIEHEGRRLGAAAGCHTVAVIDHWVNYEARFERHGVTVLPNEVWVADAAAAQIAQRTFPGVVVKEMRNFYMEAMVRDAGPLPGDGDILYVLEPVRRPWGDSRPGEFQALDYFLEKLPQLGVPSDVSIRLRPHPSDPPGKYEAWRLAHAAVNIAMDDAPSLAAAIRRARWVAGCESMAMVVALAAGRTVFSTLPPAAPPCSLPHAGIVHLTKIGARP